MPAAAATFQMNKAVTAGGVALSVVAPVCNEEDNVGPLLQEIETALEGVCDFEVIFVNDRSSDGTLEALQALKQAHPKFRALSHYENAGQSRALRTGILAARGAVIGTLDGDGQNDPADLPKLYQALVRNDADGDLAMVAGERVGRKDTAAKRFASRIANTVRQSILKDGASDTGCGLKVFYRDAYLRLPYFDHMHRYIPALIQREGFKAEFLPVGHRPRVHGASKYNNLSRALVAFRDILGVVWLRARFRSPGEISEL